MALATYLKEKGIDEKEDDQEFMETEYDAVRTYCEICGYVITDADLETVKARGLEESFISWRQEALYPILPVSFKNSFGVVKLSNCCYGCKTFKICYNTGRKDYK